MTKLTDPTIIRQREVERRQRVKEEKRAAKLTEQLRQHNQPAPDSRRLAALEREWEWFKLGMQQAQHRQQQQAALRYRQQLIDEIGKLIGPPQPQEPEVIYLEERGPDLLFTEAHPWWG
jgi:hypothetical protein